MPRSYTSYMANLAKKRALARSGHKTIVSTKFDNIKLNDKLIVAFGAELTKTTKKIIKELERLAKSNLYENDSVRTGLLKKAIRGKFETYENTITVDGKKQKTFGIWGAVGIDRAVEGIDENGAKVWPLKYAHLVEFGHLKGNNKRGGAVPPKPFMRDALASIGGVLGIQEMMKDAAKRGLKKGASQ